MATPTSSNNRSKRKTNKPVTQGQNPQRSNRQKVSQAQVTTGEQRARGTARVTNASQRTNTGSANVSGSSRLALPPGKPGGNLAKLPTPMNPRRQQAQAKADKAAKGTTGPNRVGQPSGAANRIYGANVVNAAVKRAQQTARFGKLAGAAGKALGAVGAVGAMAGEVKAMSDRSKSFSWNRPKPKPDPNGRSSTGVRVSDNANKRDYKAAPTGSQQYNDYRNQQIAAERERLKGVGNPPAAKPRASAPQSSSTSRSSTSGRPSRPSTPAPRRIPSPASDAGMKNQDKNYRGNLFEKTFGYKAGGAPDQVRDRTSNLSNKFGQDSGYQPKTKVDGSQYADKKPDMAKVKEYDRRKRRYYDS